MTDQIVITGVAPYDGHYDLDLDQELTTREWGWIKRLAGYLPLTLTDDSFGDPEFVCVLAAIAIHRSGRIQPGEVPSVFERLADAPFGSTVTLEGQPDTEEESERDPSKQSSSSNGATSGTSSPPTSATPATPPNPTGAPGSGTSASAPVTSAN